ncbi:ketoacyl-ACP synthase III family protein [Streptomyces sp. NBC_01186]|uniref:ketoacyl-ACP synthase III family protein n=1 Tax=Streptomyces sp. NBC_01186 TaxID=2903765 RepID=UPI002E0DD637|nr:ketoacyl-ACP synthase III family protein [Streptomyces sp. NBC_01186]
MRVSDLFISGLGTYLPETVSVEQAVAQGLYPELEAELHELEGAAVAGDTPAPEMALYAAQHAFKRCGRRPTDLDLLLYVATWHQGPEGWLPHSYLQRHLTGGDLTASEIHLGCNGMFSALELAVGHLRAEPGRRAALLVAADNYGTPMTDRWRMGPGYICGDAASALVLTKDEGFAQLLAVRSATVPEAEELHRGAEPLFPPGILDGRGLDFGRRNEEYRQQSRAGGGGTLALFTIQQRLTEVIDATLEDAGLTVADLTRVAFMNYARDIVEQRCMVPLDLPLEKSTWEFGRTVGHCGASDQILSLDHLVTTGRLGAGDHMLLLGTGPGVTLSCAVVKVLSAPPWAE